MTRIQTFAFLLFSLFFWQQSNAQIFFTEDFEGLTGANGLPTGWTETGLSTDGIYDVGPIRMPMQQVLGLLLLIPFLHRPMMTFVTVTSQQTVLFYLNRTFLLAQVE